MMIALARLTFLILVALLPFVRVVEVNFGGFPLPITDLIFPFCAVLWMGALARKQTQLKWNPLFIFLGIYLSVLACSVTVSPDPWRSLTKLAGEAYLFTLCFLSFQLFSDESFRPKAIKAWLFGTAATVLATVFAVALFYLGAKTQSDNSMLSHFGSLPAGNYPRIRSLFANANMAANYLNVSLMIVVYARASGILKDVFGRLLNWGVWFAALLTISPGLGGLALSSGLWSRRRNLAEGKTRLAAVSLIAGLVVAVGFFAATLVSYDTTNTDKQINVFGRTIEPSVRVLVWESALATIADNPLLGRGVGIDPAAVRYETLSGDRQFLRDAHNIPLNVAGQSGLLGLAAFGFVVFFIVSTIRRNAAGNESLYILSLAFIGAFLYQGLTGSFEDARHLWVLIGFLMAVKGDKSA